MGNKTVDEVMNNIKTKCYMWENSKGIQVLDMNKIKQEINSLLYELEKEANLLHNNLHNGKDIYNDLVKFVRKISEMRGEK